MQRAKYERRAAQSSCYLNASPRRSITPVHYFGSVYPGDRGGRKKRIIEAGAITLIGQSDFLP
jgi:hypothetical protein